MLRSTIMCSLLLQAVLSFQPSGLPLRVMAPHGSARGPVTMADVPPPQQPDKVKVTIRKKEKPGAPAQKGWVFMVVSFEHVKESLATFLKFWLMGGCGAVGWSGTGETNAKHTSGTEASIEIDVEKSTVTLRSASEDSYNTRRQLSRYATALLDELEGLAKTEEAAEADRLCYPSAAADSARTVVMVQMASATAPPPQS